MYFTIYSSIIVEPGMNCIQYSSLVTWFHETGVCESAKGPCNRSATHFREETSQDSPNASHIASRPRVGYQRTIALGKLVYAAAWEDSSRGRC